MTKPLLSEFHHSAFGISANPEPPPPPPRPESDGPGQEATTTRARRALEKVLSR